MRDSHLYIYSNIEIQVNNFGGVEYPCASDVPGPQTVNRIGGSVSQLLVYEVRLTLLFGYGDNFRLSYIVIAKLPVFCLRTIRADPRLHVLSYGRCFQRGAIQFGIMVDAGRLPFDCGKPTNKRPRPVAHQLLL